MAARGRICTYEDAVWVKEVADGRTGGEELRIGYDFELNTWSMESELRELEVKIDLNSCHREGHLERRQYSVVHELGCADGNSRFLKNYGAGTGVLGNYAGNGLESRHIGGDACADAMGLGWCVDSNHNQVGIGNGSGDVSGEEEVGLALGQLDVGRGVSSSRAGGHA